MLLRFLMSIVTMRRAQYYLLYKTAVYYIFMSETSYKTIVIRKEVYDDLRQLGCTGDSFNDVITALVADAKIQKQEGPSCKH